MDSCASIAGEMKAMSVDVVPLLHELREQGKNILFEGAQGAMLDVDLGTYLRNVVQYDGRRDRCRYGIWSAISGLRTGHYQSLCDARWLWALSTELFDDIGAGLAERGHEFGSTTGRPRRCGWFDAVALRQAVQVNSISGLCLTKLDVLDGLDTIKICVGYEDGGIKDSGPNFGSEFYEGVSPVYEEVPGWKRILWGFAMWLICPPRRRTTFAWLKKRWVRGGYHFDRARQK